MTPSDTELLVRVIVIGLAVVVILVTATAFVVSLVRSDAGDEAVADDDPPARLDAAERPRSDVPRMRGVSRDFARLGAAGSRPRSNGHGGS